jgi:hypothetical protein
MPVYSSARMFRLERPFVKWWVELVSWYQKGSKATWGGSKISNWTLRITLKWMIKSVVVFHNRMTHLTTNLAHRPIAGIRMRELIVVRRTTFSHVQHEKNHVSYCWRMRGDVRPHGRWKKTDPKQYCGAQSTAHGSKDAHKDCPVK